MAYYHCDIEELANTERPFLRIAKYDDDDSLAMEYVHLFDNTPEELQAACRAAVDVALHGDLACIPTKYANELGMYPDEENIESDAYSLGIPCRVWTSDKSIDFEFHGDINEDKVYAKIELALLREILPYADQSKSLREVDKVGFVLNTTPNNPEVSSSSYERNYLLKNETGTYFVEIFPSDQFDEEDEIPDDALLLTGNVFDLSVDESGCIDMDEADIDQPGMFWGYKDPSEYMEDNFGIKSTYAVSETIGDNLWVSVSNHFAEALKNGKVTPWRLNNIIEKASLIAEDSPHQAQDIDFYKEVSNARRL